MPKALDLLLLVQLIALASGATAPGDEDDVCRTLRASGVIPTLDHPANMKVLMDSWNYENLLSPHTGAVWEQVDNDQSGDETVGVVTNGVSLAEKITH